MIKIFHSNVSAMSDEQFFDALGTYPLPMQKDIDRYRFMADKKRRLLSRAIVRQYLRQQGYPDDLRDWAIDSNKKPYLPQAPEFNISHSGDKVVVAFSDQVIGIDVEIEGAIDMNAIVHLFHPEEIDYFNRAENAKQAFFNIWVRKEAFLKAVGIGIIKGLDTVSVLEDIVDFDDRKWFLQKIDYWSGYQSALCTPFPQVDVKLLDYELNP